MKSRLPLSGRKESPKSGSSKAFGFDSVQAYPVAPASEQPPVQLHPQSGGNDGVMQLKGYVWKQATSTWEEVSADEKGKAMPAGLTGTQDGMVYDSDTGIDYKNVAEYKEKTAAITNPKFIYKPQSAAELAALAAASEKGITPYAGAGARLTSFLQHGVLLPSALGGKATTSADATHSEDFICVNKFSPTSTADAASTATYATMHDANGAIPVVMENSADVLRPGDQPDLGTLAMRAHNSALAIIDPTKLGKAAHVTINAAGDGEMRLRTTIPSQCFVAVLIPLHLKPLVSPEDAKEFNIQFIGSKNSSASYNFKDENRNLKSRNVKVSIPDYEQALKNIFQDNPKSTFLTHIIRLSPTAPIAITRANANPAAGAAAVGGAAAAPSYGSAAAAAAASTGSVSSGAATASSTVAHNAAAGTAANSKSAAKEADTKEKANEKSTKSAALPPAVKGKTIHEIALAVCAKCYKMNPGVNIGSLQDAKITDANDLLTKHEAEGVTDAKKVAVFEDLSDIMTWYA